MTTETLSQDTRQDSLVQPQPADMPEQYTLAQILGIVALVTVPMGLLAWVVAPAVIPYSPLHPGMTFWLLIILGMIWQCVVSLVIVYRELGTLKWSAIRERTWLRTPLDPKTDEPNAKLYWWVLLPLIFNVLTGFIFADALDAPMTWLFPWVQPASYMDVSQLASPEFRGQWWIVGVMLLSFAFNYFLGEEFLFRGVLLPKMKGVFGRYDWIANAVLFGVYHIHLAWHFPSIVLSNLALSWPAARFRSNWMAIIVHSTEGLPTLIIVLGVILGLIG